MFHPKECDKEQRPLFGMRDEGQERELYWNEEREVSEHGVSSRATVIEGVGSLPCIIATVFGVFYVLCVSTITQEVKLMESSFYGLADRIPDLLICGNVDVLDLVSIVYVFKSVGK